MANRPTGSIAAGPAAQTAARRAWTFAMLHVFTIAIVDAPALVLLGRLHHGAVPRLLRLSMKPEAMQVLALAILGLSLAFKVQCSLRTFRFAKQAAREATPAGEKAYRGNARGAKVTTVLCGLVTAAVLAVAYLQVS